MVEIHGEHLSGRHWTEEGKEGCSDVRQPKEEREETSTKE